jgi:hypothetical protein
VLKGEIMSGYVIAIAVFGLTLAILGFCMAFWQSAIRRVLRRPLKPTQFAEDGNREDAMTYILRIAGVMTMVFGIAIAGMFTFMGQNS